MNEDTISPVILAKLMGPQVLQLVGYLKRIETRKDEFKVVQAKLDKIDDSGFQTFKAELDDNLTKDELPETSLLSQVTTTQERTKEIQEIEEQLRGTRGLEQGKDKIETDVKLKRTTYTSLLGAWQSAKDVVAAITSLPYKDDKYVEKYKSNLTQALVELGDLTPNQTQVIESYSSQFIQTVTNLLMAVVGVSTPKMIAGQNVSEEINLKQFISTYKQLLGGSRTPSTIIPYSGIIRMLGGRSDITDSQIGQQLTQSYTSLWKRLCDSFAEKSHDTGISEENRQDYITAYFYIYRGYEIDNLVSTEGEPPEQWLIKVMGIMQAVESILKSDISFSERSVLAKVDRKLKTEARVKFIVHPFQDHDPELADFFIKEDEVKGENQ
jgi:hypothetical protein